MELLIVLVFIAFGEPPQVIDVYESKKGAYHNCIENAKMLNVSTKHGRWDCSIKHKEDLKG